MTTRTKKHLKTLLALLTYGLMAYFIVAYAERLDFSKLSDLQVNWWYAVAAVPVSVAARAFLPYIWIQLIRVYQPIDNRGEYWQLNYIYAKTWLARYLPGKLAWVGGKIYFALKRGIDKIVLGVTAIVEIVLQLLTALLLGGAFLYISGAYANFSLAYNLFFLTATAGCMVMIAPPVFNRLLRLGYKLIRRKDLAPRYHVKLVDLLKISSLYLVVQGLNALPIYFIVQAIGVDVSPVELIYISGAFIFAGAIGTLALFAPGGLGVREGVALVFLANVLPVEVGVVLVIALRLWSIILDVLYWLLSYGVVYIMKRRATSS